MQAFIDSLTDDDVTDKFGPDKLEPLPRGSAASGPSRPHSTQPRDPGEPQEEQEWGPGVQQRELREYSPNTQVACDGPHCAYAEATLPGSGRRPGDSIGVAPVKLENTADKDDTAEAAAEKKLVRHLQSSLGRPCVSACAPSAPPAAGRASAFTARNFGGDPQACVAACKADKVARVRALMRRIAAMREANAGAVARGARAAKDKDTDKKREGGAGARHADSRQYSAVKASTGSLEAPAETFTDSEELHCSVSTRTREVCSMCGGRMARRFRGFRVERMSPREQRFVPQYPFATRALQAAVRRLLKATAPHAINTMSLAGHGSLTCISSSPAPSVFSSLAALGVNLTQWGAAQRHAAGARPPAAGAIPPGVIQICDRVLLAGQPSEAELAALARAGGLRGVLDLRTHEELGACREGHEPDGRPCLSRDEQALVQGLGLTYLNVPVPRHGPYAAELCATVSQALQGLIRAGRAPVLVHCRSGARAKAVLEAAMNVGALGTLPCKPVCIRDNSCAPFPAPADPLPATGNRPADGDWGVDAWRLMLGQPTVERLKSTGVSSMRVAMAGRRDITLPVDAERAVGLGARGGEAGVRRGREGGDGGGGDAAGAAAAHGAGPGVYAVSIMWAESRTPWGAGTRIVDRLIIRDAVGVVEVRAALGGAGSTWLGSDGAIEVEPSEIRPYINGSMPFGDVDVAVTASQGPFFGADTPPRTVFGALSGSFPARVRVRVGDVLAGFGCGGRGIVGGAAVACDPLPPVPASGGAASADDGLSREARARERAVLLRIGLGAEAEVEDARLESVFEGGSQLLVQGEGREGWGQARAGSTGRVFHVLRGVMHTWPKSDVQMFATFVPEQLAAEGTDTPARMEFVWEMKLGETSGVTAAALIKTVSDIVAPATMDADLDLRQLALVVSRYDISLQAMPLPAGSLRMMRVAAGLNLHATLLLSEGTAVGRMLLPMFAAATGESRGRAGWGDTPAAAAEGEWREISLGGPVTPVEVRLEGQCADLELAGQSRLVDASLHVVVRASVDSGRVGGARAGALEVCLNVSYVPVSACMFVPIQ